MSEKKKLQDGEYFAKTENGTIRCTEFNGDTLGTMIQRTAQDLKKKLYFEDPRQTCTGPGGEIPERAARCNGRELDTLRKYMVRHKQSWSGLKDRLAKRLDHPLKGLTDDLALKWLENVTEDHLTLKGLGSSGSPTETYIKRLVGKNRSKHR